MVKRRTNLLQIPSPSQAWWCRPIIPALGRLWVGSQPGLHSEFQASLGYPISKLPSHWENYRAIWYTKNSTCFLLEYKKRVSPSRYCGLWGSLDSLSSNFHIPVSYSTRNIWRKTMKVNPWVKIQFPQNVNSSLLLLSTYHSNRSKKEQHILCKKSKYIKYLEQYTST
jgi:hypothetical protein